MERKPRSLDGAALPPRRRSGDDPGGDRRKIVRAHVRFSLNDSAYALRTAVVVNEMKSDELARHEEGVLAGIKRAG